MAWNKEILLKKIIEVQELTLKYKAKGVTQTWIYREIIYPRFIISESTYNNYLSRNAKKELNELLSENEKKQKMDKTGGSAAHQTLLFPPDE